MSTPATTRAGATDRGNHDATAPHQLSRRLTTETKASSG